MIVQTRADPSLAIPITQPVPKETSYPRPEAIISPSFATLLVVLGATYLGLGVGFAIAFVTVGVGRLDPVAREGTVGFRLLILPGAAALWPLLAYRWISGATCPPVERNAHRDAAR